MKDLERIKRINKGEWLEGQHQREPNKTKWDFILWLFIIGTVMYFLIRFLIG